MSNDNGKISVKQSMIFIIIIFCAPAIRYIPLFTAQQAKQAAWISPLIAIVFEIIYMLVWTGFIKRYASKSYIDIIKDTVGKLLGNIICIMYFLWITFLLSYNVRMYSERIVTTAMPGVSIFIVLGAMLLIVGYIVKNGIITLAKMAELFFIALSLIFIVYNVLILPKVELQNIFPITYKDAFPIFKANFGIIAIFAYNILIFIFNDKIEHNGDFKKLSMKTIIILSIISFLVIIIPLSVFGWSILVKMPIPYINTMTEISLFDVIERIESGIIMFWIISDFVLIATFIYTAMHIIRLSFKLSNVRAISIIYIIGIFFLSIILARSTIELSVLSLNILTPMNIIMGYFIPIFIYIIAKIRKKV
ncbi:MAG: gerKB4 [Clostridia bacterium]|jgi:spore germination protein (amino acid permease)|nr:gerKB4 [Clostridia bacterium]